MAAPRKIDYDRIEPAWRAGIKSPKQLAADYTEDTGVSVSHVAIIKHFGKLGIPRDLQAKIRAKSDAMVNQAMVTGKITKETIRRETEIVNEGAAFVSTIRLSQRADIAEAMNLLRTLKDELKGQTASVDSLTQLCDMLANGDVPDAQVTDRMLAGMMGVISLPSRLKMAKDVADTLHRLISLEREAYNLGLPDPTPPANPVAATMPDDLIEATRVYQRLMTGKQ